MCCISYIHPTQTARVCKISHIDVKLHNGNKYSGGQLNLSKNQDVTADPNLTPKMQNVGFNQQQCALF